MPNNSAQLPTYADHQIKSTLLRAGASGTVYSLVMPESEAALAHVLDGGDQQKLIEATAAKSTKDISERLARSLSEQRMQQYFSMYHEPWSQKQDTMHEDYFDKWFDWIAPVVSVNDREFPFRYPTAGASEGIFKIMAEYATSCATGDTAPIVHMFEGEYEGFPAYAASLGVRVVRHQRQDWKAAAQSIGKDEQFWISQPSAIDGQVWEPFGDFITCLNKSQPSAEVIPDLTYVGNVARDYQIDLTSLNIPAIVFSHSKPFGGYYHRVGGVVSRREFPSLFGNKWFKNLQSLAWGSEMMKRHGVNELARKYRPDQERAVELVGSLLGIHELQPADVSLLATAHPTGNESDLLKNVLRGSGNETVIRLCLTPAMTCLINPGTAPQTYPMLREVWDEMGQPT